MRREVQLTELGQGRGPRVLLLPGLGARGSGFLALARCLEPVCRPVLVEYPEGLAAACGAGALARQVLRAAGALDAVVASSFGGMVAAHLAAAGPREAWRSWAPLPAPSTWACAGSPSG